MTADALIPHLADEAAYRAVFADGEVWQRPMQVLAERHGLDPAGLRRETLGSHIVYGDDTVIVKLFYNGWRHDFAAEHAALRHAGELPVPRIIAEGELEGWPYMVLSRLPGVPAGTVWDKLGREDQLDLMTQAGALMRRLHDLSPAPGLDTDWDAFLAVRFRQAPAHHGLGEPWRSWMEARLRTFDAGSPTLLTLHADITADHIFVEESAGRWRLVGLIDFGDARLGDPLYEFIAPLAFFCFGQPEMSQALLRGYGVDATAATREQLTTFCLLHEFGRVQDFLDRHVVVNGPGFEQALWGDRC